MIRLTIPGEVVPQGRPRFARCGTYVHTYNPRKSSEYRERVKIFAKRLRIKELLDGPLNVKIAIYMQIPGSWSKKKTAKALAGELRPTTQSDIDNLSKGILDACNKILWRDDSRIVRLEVEKYYSDEPRAEIEIEEVTP